MALATLSIDLVAQLASLQAGMDKAGRIADKSAAQIEARFAKMRTFATGIGAALGAAIPVTLLANLARATIDGVDALNDLSDATGASIENLSALEDIAARTGTPLGTVGDSLVRLNKVLTDATPGTPMAQALKAIGLSADELRKQDPAEALRRVAAALGGYADDAGKARLVQELFGRSVREVAPLLKDLAGAGKLNATVTAEQAVQAEAFNRELAVFSKNMVDGARAITGGMVPALNQFFERVRGLSKAGGFGKFIGLEVDANLAADRLRVVTAQMEELQAYMDGQKLPRPALAKRMEDLRQEANRLTKDALAAADALKRFADVGAPLANGRRPPNEGGGGLRSRTIDYLGGSKVAPTSRDKAFVGNSFDQDTIAALRALEATDTTRLRELESALTGLFSLQRETRGDPAVAQAIAKVRAEIEALSTKKMPDAEPLRAYTDALAAIEGTKAAEITAVSAALDELFKMRQTPLGGPEVDEAINTLRDKLKTLKEPLAEVNTFAQEAGKNIQDALGDTLLASMQGSAGKIDRIWGDMLKRLTAQIAAAQLGNLLIGDFAKTNKVGGWVGDLFSWIGTSFGGARAAGGPVRAGRPYLVGERGPELVVPRSNGTVLPNGTALVGETTNNFSVVVQGDASENTLRLIRGALAQYEARMLMRSA